MVEALGILETTGFTPGIVALDAMDKTAGIRVVQAELNDFLGVVIKVAGTTSGVQAAMEAGRNVAEQMQGRPIARVIYRPDARAWAAIESRPEISPLLAQSTVLLPAAAPANKTPGTQQKEHPLAETSTAFALGFLETQGFTAVFEAIDSACKAANVEVLAKEKLGGGYITVVIKGDVAAVKAAVEAGRARVEGLGKLIAAHVIARPSPAALSLLPKL